MPVAPPAQVTRLDDFKAVQNMAIGIATEVAILRSSHHANIPSFHDIITSVPLPAVLDAINDRALCDRLLTSITPSAALPAAHVRCTSQHDTLHSLHSMRHCTWSAVQAPFLGLCSTQEPRARVGRNVDTSHSPCTRFHGPEPRHIACCEMVSVMHSQPKRSGSAA